MKKKLFLSLLFMGVSLLGNDAVKDKISNKQALKDFVLNDAKVSLLDKEIQSTGYKFLVSELDKITDLSSYGIVELYSKSISSEWKVSIFDIELEYFNGTKEIVKRKIFYNNSLVVNDIFNEKAESIGKKINLPLMSDLVYNQEYQLLKRDENKPSPRGENMVVFTNSQCPFCKQYVPAMLDYALENNMNLYVINLSSKKFENSEESAINIIAFLKYDKRSPKDKIETIKSIYSKGITSKDDFLTLFKIDKNILDKENMDYSKELLEINNKIAKKIHIIETPTVYIDGILFTEYGI